MALYQFPETILPAPSVQFSGSIMPAVTRSKMDSGEIRQRARFIEEGTTYKVVWNFNDFQRAFFKGIFKNKIDNGSAWFLITLPSSGGLSQTKARIVGGEYSETHLSNFNWQISLTLEAKEIPVLSESSLDVLLEFNGVHELFFSEAERLYNFINITLPTTLQN